MNRIVDTLSDMAHDVSTPAYAGQQNKQLTLLLTVSPTPQLADAPMLARTHGQPATPTTLGKELANFACVMQQPPRSHPL